MHSPRNTGLRFSTNARTASRKSVLPYTTRIMSSISASCGALIRASAVLLARMLSGALAQSWSVIS